ncbi:Arm DNA-binding domain-containing protein [Roseimarinus sediminis]|uniref:Arm DNA-binding domain-containing protein n=1 Tax=Roseimarinus sediminis TaxID=1610899 RepID=UPI003D1D78E1
MQKVNLSILYLPRANKNKVQNMDRLYARVTVNGERVEVSTGRSIPQGVFDIKAQRCPGKTKEARQINLFLDSFTFRINQIRHDLSDNGFEVSAESIKRVYNGLPPVDDVSHPKIIEFYKVHNEELKTLIGIDITYATLERHSTSLKHLSNFGIQAD